MITKSTRYYSHYTPPIIILRRPNNNGSSSQKKIRFPFAQIEKLLFVYNGLGFRDPDASSKRASSGRILFFFLFSFLFFFPTYQPTSNKAYIVKKKKIIPTSLRDFSTSLRARGNENSLIDNRRSKHWGLHS